MQPTNTDRERTTPSCRRLVTGAVAMGVLLLLVGCFGPEKSDVVAHTEEADSVGQRPKSVAPYWVDPDSNAAREVRRLNDRGRSAHAELMAKIARQPVAEWVGTEDPRGQVERVTRAAEKADRRSLLVLYNLPHRDCGQYSKGGAADAGAYREWLGSVIEGIGDRAATVVVEPDSLPHLLAEGCTPPQFHDERYQLLRHAVTELKSLPDTRVYLDAGNPDWVREPGGLVEPLKRAGIDEADGFALNVSNYQTTASNTAYGKRLSPMVGNKPFVIDTSRNGSGPVEAAAGDEEAWCNPDGRALGEPPTVKTGDERVAAYLWIKRPGESDGECKGGPGAGTWWPEYAFELARNAQH